VTGDLKDAASRFSAVYPVMDDAALRQLRGMKIAAILQEVLRMKSPGVLLDVGCSNGIVLDVVAAKLAPGFALGIDMDAAVAPPPVAGRVVAVADAMAIPLATDSVDVVICNHTYEHVPDATQLFSEIHRVLKPGGIVYFSAMNARWPMEPHYHLPFLHWLPDAAAAWLLRQYGYGNAYLEKPLSTSGLRRLVRNFDIEDYTLKVIGQPAKYHAQDLFRMPGLGALYLLVARLCYGLLPGYLWILTKR
jgi:SAM-dependent methyltransferase